jgi:hypothetical protein
MGRRGFLGRTMAVLAAGASLTAIATSQPASAAVTEDPALVDAGQRIEALQAEWRTADALRLKARALAESICPPIPDELLCDQRVIWAGCRDYQRDVEGRDLRDRCMILASYEMEAAIERGTLSASKRTRWGRSVYRLISVAKKYETEREAAIKQSGVLDCKRRVCLAAHQLQDLAWEVVEIEPRTMARVAAHA